MKCPACGSADVSRYTSHGITCNECGNMGRADSFGAECNCEKPHHLPAWRCPVHGDVSVPMD